MASFNLQADAVSRSTPKLARGEIRITAEVPVYYRIGNDPVANDRCAFIAAGKTLTVRLPTSCLQLAVLAVNTPGGVTVAEVNGTKASCSQRS